MPVSPDGAARFAKVLADLYGDAAAHLIATVARRLAEGITEPGWAEKKLAQILELRADAQQVVQALGEFTPDQALQALLDSYQAGVTEAGGAGVQEAADELVATNTGAVRALAHETARTLSYTHTRILRTTEDIYRRTIAETAGQVVTGAQSRREATARALSRFAAQGVTGFTDARGRNWSLESYAEMATRTAAGQAHIQGGLDRYAQQGRHLVIVSDAPEECPLCRPFEGRVLSLTGREPTPAEMAGHRYGGTLEHARGAGFMHPNCRHALDAFVPGLTRPVTHDTEDPEGDELRQQQRALERRVRESKRRLAAVEPLGDTTQLARERALLRRRQADLTQFVAAHDRKRLRYREQIGSPAPLPKPPPSVESSVTLPSPEKHQVALTNVAQPPKPMPLAKKQLTLHNLAEPKPPTLPEPTPTAPPKPKNMTFEQLFAQKKAQQKAAPTPVPKAAAPKPAAPRKQQPAPAPAAPPRGGALTGDHYAALKPANAWSRDRRDAIAADLRKTRAGARFVEAVDRFQDGGQNIPRLRNAIAKRAAGEEVAGAWGERADAWIDAIRHAPSEMAPDKLYRGMVLPGDPAAVMARYRPGETLDLSLSSFTSDRRVAVKFQDYAQRPGKSTKVMVEIVGDGKKAVPIQNMTAPERANYFSEKEWVSMGRYRVKEVKVAPGGGIIVRIAQEGTL